MKDLATRKAEEVAERAHVLATEIANGNEAIEKAWLLMGQKLYEFKEIEGWRHDGSDAQNFEEWCGPRERPSYSYASQLIQIYRTYCVNFGVDVERLAAAKSVHNLLTGTKALNAGRGDPEQIIADAEALSPSDMKALYDGGKRNEDGGPNLRKCPTCKTLVPEGKLA